MKCRKRKRKDPPIKKHNAEFFPSRKFKYKEEDSSDDRKFCSEDYIEKFQICKEKNLFLILSRRVIMNLGGN